MKQAQLQDPVLEEIRKHASRPPFTAISDQSPEVKYWWARWEQLVDDDGLAALEWREGDTVRLRYLVPESLRNVLLRQYHDSLQGGHFGVDRVVERLRFPHSCGHASGALWRHGWRGVTSAVRLSHH